MTEQTENIKQKETKKRDFKDFYAIVYPILGAMLGILIAIPIISITSNIFVSIILLILFTFASAKIAYKNRHVKAFLFFLLIAILVMINLVGQNA